MKERFFLPSSFKCHPSIRPTPLKGVSLALPPVGEWGDRRNYSFNLSMTLLVKNMVSIVNKSSNL